ncbi:hypothetical protein CEXT_738051 [Caerostris extrusa]|uniref:Uncharacterized protein n=1 Tax=Caerostris extrusa TaxID=172846 RepID=A0AAV4T7P2_CAEEX|nr:hypothetical protein CEXT_738051 [Caerostris extrusa]
MINAYNKSFRHKIRNNMYHNLNKLRDIIIRRFSDSFELPSFHFHLDSNDSSDYDSFHRNPSVYVSEKRLLIVITFSNVAHQRVMRSHDGIEK